MVRLGACARVPPIPVRPRHPRAGARRASAHLRAAVLLEDAGPAGERRREVGAERGGVAVGAGVREARAQAADLGERVLGPELLRRAGLRAAGGERGGRGPNLQEGGVREGGHVAAAELEQQGVVLGVGDSGVPIGVDTRDVPVDVQLCGEEQDFVVRGVAAGEKGDHVFGFGNGGGKVLPVKYGDGLPSKRYNGVANRDGVFTVLVSVEFICSATCSKHNYPEGAKFSD